MIHARDIEMELLAFVQREVFAPDVVLTVETDLIAAGFDSMSLVRVMLFLESTYGLWVPEGEVHHETLRNLRTLAETVARLLHAR